MSNTMTGAIAIIKSNGVPIGKMRNVTITENVRRQDVRGLGRITVAEAPAVEHAGTMRAGFYEVDFSETGIPNAIRRDVQTIQEFEDNILLDHDGIQVDVFKKVEDFIDPATGLRRAKLEPYAVVTRVLFEQEDIDISEGQVSGRNQSFKFLDPVIFPA